MYQFVFFFLFPFFCGSKHDSGADGSDKEDADDDDPDYDDAEDADVGEDEEGEVVDGDYDDDEDAVAVDNNHVVKHHNDSMMSMYCNFVGLSSHLAFKYHEPLGPFREYYPCELFLCKLYYTNSYNTFFGHLTHY